MRSATASESLGKAVQKLDKKPRILDLFCGAGGAAMGYHRAGWDVVGVDINPQPRYPFAFVQSDALELLRTGAFWMPDAIHASPPCQHYSDLAGRNGNADAHPDLIGPVRELLKASGLPYVIENVEGAPLIDPILICGTERGMTLAFGVPKPGYRLRRHRLFETNWGLETLGCGCANCDLPVMDVLGGDPSLAPRLDGAGGRTYKGTADQARSIMGIGWMSKAELNEAIPPAYTQLVGAQLLAFVRDPFRDALNKIAFDILVDSRWGHDSIPAPNLDCAKSAMFNARYAARAALAGRAHA